jgi:hypothetical protein
MKFYKKFNRDIQERIDNFVIQNNKIVFDNVLKELKKEQFVKNIFTYLLDNQMITLENYKDHMSIYSVLNNESLTILIWKEGRRVILNTEFNNNTNLLKINNKIKSYLVGLYNDFYRITFTKELISHL